MNAAPAPVDTTILVVDDDSGVRQLVTFLLQRSGYAVVEAVNGREAVDRVRERGGDIGAVLLDVMMPEMTGHEALPAMRQLRPDLPVIFFSGFDQNEVAEHLTGSSAYTSFVPKPFENRELIEEIQRAVENRPSRG
ncbi:MAG: response regulator [Nitriliruptor sp.]